MHCYSTEGVIAAAPQNTRQKEAKFLELWVNGQDKFNAYNKAGFKAKNTKVASAAVCRLLKKVNCSAYLEALKNEKDSELQRKNKITRTTQLNALEDAIRLAEKLNKPSAMVSAIREQNEMLGYHRETAPNAEKEAARRAMTAEEERLATEWALERTAQKAQERPKERQTGQIYQTSSFRSLEWLIRTKRCVKWLRLSLN